MEHLSGAKAETFLISLIGYPTNPVAISRKDVLYLLKKVTGTTIRVQKRIGLCAKRIYERIYQTISYRFYVDCDRHIFYIFTIHYSDQHNGHVFQSENIGICLEDLKHRFS